MYFSTDNDASLHQDAYGIANLSGGVIISNGKVAFDISVFGKNILDEKYLIDAGNVGQIWGYPTFIAGAPSMYGVGLKISFK